MSFSSVTKSASSPSISSARFTHSLASSNLPISVKHLPLRHHPFALPTLLASTLASASTAPSGQFPMAMCDCALFAYSMDTSSLTKAAGSHSGLCSAISMPWLGDIGGALRVDGDRRRRHQRDGTGRHLDVEDGAVEVVELFELGGERPRRSAAGGENGFGLGVHVNGEHAEMVEVRHP
ncbi:hypothetical protein Trco_007928 [Trichoderma cornu-damae]|uniref:Uncharacterized protein n=1 Tax=Trichoderma cornu-damae TaxID=654480 RepID=A0A9P8QHU2_9HYPO|nr:hypothetical protein Trco_007928 [Trichoderma cornu-damae]